MDLVPVILAGNESDFIRKVIIAKDLATYIQIDFMDDQFAFRKTVLPEQLLDAGLNCDFEAHLMVADPTVHLKTFQAAGAKRVIFHVEAVSDPLPVIDQIKKLGMLPGIAINPFTSIHAVKTLLKKIDTLLLLAVDPQIKDSKFYPEVTNKLQFLSPKTDLRVGIDGGIKRSNIKNFLDNRVDYICAGSAIFDEGDPYQNYLSLKQSLGV